MAKYYVMRIGIDARMCGPKHGGLGRYVEQLILHLSHIDDRNEYVIFLREDNWSALNLSNKNFIQLLANIPWYGWREQREFPKIIKKAKVDLMHFPHWNAPLLYNDPFVATIHDLILLHYPTREASALGPFSYWFKNMAFKKVLRHAVDKAKYVIAPSEFTKQDTHHTLGVPLKKITVTHLAPAERNEEEGMRKENPQSIASLPHSSSPLPRRYALYVGVAYPHKNLTRLLQAWKLFQQKYGNGYQLCLVGKRNYFYNKLLNSNLAIEQLSNEAINFTDYLSDSELAEVYSKASLYIFPSLYEGFGLPPLEAMQCNIPVVSSNRACLPEILQDAALYFDPENIQEMSDAIYQGFTDKTLRETLQNNAQKLLLNYSWEKTAQKTLAIYESALANDSLLKKNVL